MAVKVSFALEGASAGTMRRIAHVDMGASFAAMIQAEIDSRHIEHYIGSLRSHLHGKWKTVRQKGDLQELSTPGAPTTIVLFSKRRERTSGNSGAFVARLAAHTAAHKHDEGCLGTARTGERRTALGGGDSDHAADIVIPAHAPKGRWAIVRFAVPQPRVQ
jgi:hypothetical protein